MRWIYATIILASAILIVWRIMMGRAPNRSIGMVGFRDYVKNPALRVDVHNSFAHREAEVARLVTLPAQELVTLLLDETQFHRAKKAIELAGPAIVPYLLSALSEPAFQQKSDGNKQATTHLMLRRSKPMVTLIECLQHYAPDEAIEKMTRFVNDPDKEVRKETARLLGNIGSAPALAPVTALMSDADDWVRQGALNGILRAIKAGRLADEFRAGAFEAVQAWVFQRDETATGDAPRCLLALDRNRAIEFLTSSEKLVAGREGLQYVLRSFREASVVLDESILLTLISSLEGNVKQYPNAFVIGEAIRLLAKVDTESAHAEILRGLESESQDVREHSAGALAARCGVEQPFDFAFDRLELVGWPGLTLPQRNMLAVRILIDEVNNGGFAQYFVNSSGDRWADALVGLEAMGNTSDLVLFQNALSLFGANTPSKDPTLRHHQLSRMVQDDDDLFSAIEEQFYKDNEDREVILLQYIVANSSDFRDAHAGMRDADRS